MGNTSIARKLRTASVALALFVASAGIGWQLADFVFPGETTAPMVAAIQFEGARPYATFGRATASPPSHEAAQPPVIAPRGAGDSRRPPSDAPAPGPSEEERNLAAALRWAEQYRQRQETAGQDAVAMQQHSEMQKVAAADSSGWTEVAENAMRFGLGRPVQGVIQAQVERERSKTAAGKLASAAANAAKVPLADRSADPVAPRVEVRAAECTGACGGRSARKQIGTTKRPVGHQRRMRANRVAGDGARTVICPLQWLEQGVFADPVVERRGRHFRRASAG